MHATLRWGSLCGMVVPLLDAVITGLVSAWQRHYTPLGDYISQLGVPERPGSWLLSDWWIVFPFLFIPFAVAVRIGTLGDPHAWVAPVLLGAAGVLVGLCGVFHCDPGCLGRTFPGRAHLLVSSLASLVLCPCPAILWATTRRDERWRGTRRFNLLTQTAGAAALAVLLCAYRHLVPLVGLWERTFWGVYQVWVFITAFTLFRRANLLVPPAPSSSC